MHRWSWCRLAEKNGRGGEGEGSQRLIKILTQLGWEENTGKGGGSREEEDIYSILSYAYMKEVRGLVIICKSIVEFLTAFRLSIG